MLGRTYFAKHNVIGTATPQNPVLSHFRLQQLDRLVANERPHELHAVLMDLSISDASVINVNNFLNSDNSQYTQLDNSSTTVMVIGVKWSEYEEMQYRTYHSLNGEKNSKEVKAKRAVNGFLTDYARRNVDLGNAPCATMHKYWSQHLELVDSFVGNGEYNYSRDELEWLMKDSLLFARLPSAMAREPSISESHSSSSFHGPPSTTSTPCKTQNRTSTVTPMVSPMQAIEEANQINSGKMEASVTLTPEKKEASLPLSQGTQAEESSPSTDEERTRMSQRVMGDAYPYGQYGTPSSHESSSGNHNKKWTPDKEHESSEEGSADTEVRKMTALMEQQLEDRKVEDKSDVSPSKSEKSLAIDDYHESLQPLTETMSPPNSDEELHDIRNAKDYSAETKLIASSTTDQAEREMDEKMEMKTAAEHAEREVARDMDEEDENMDAGDKIAHLTAMFVGSNPAEWKTTARDLFNSVATSIDDSNWGACDCSAGEEEDNAESVPVEDERAGQDEAADINDGDAVEEEDNVQNVHVEDKQGVQEEEDHVENVQNVDVEDVEDVQNVQNVHVEDEKSGHEEAVGVNDGDAVETEDNKESVDVEGVQVDLFDEEEYSNDLFLSAQY